MAFLWSMGDKGKVLARCFTSLTKNNLSESCIMHSERWGFLLVDHFRCVLMSLFFKVIDENPGYF